MVLWESVTIAENEAALTLDAKESYFFVAIEASLSILLDGLLNYFLHRIDGVFTAGSRRITIDVYSLAHDFFLFLYLIFLNEQACT